MSRIIKYFKGMEFDFLKIEEKILVSKFSNNREFFINEQLLERITSSFWAIYFCNYGNYSYNYKNRTKSFRLNIGKFLPIERNLIENYFNNLGFDCYQLNAGHENKYCTLHFKAQGRDKFINFISEFMPKSMLFKLNVITPDKHWNRMQKYPNYLTEEQEDLIYGSLLGDAGIYIYSKMNYPYFKVGHSQKQEDYLYKKFNILKPFINYNDIKFKLRYDTFKNAKPFGQFETICHPLFLDIRNEFYDENGIKHVTQNILNKINERALMWWFCDDGSYSGSLSKNCEKYYMRGTLHTQSFSLEENQLLQRWFKEKWDIQCSITKRPNNKFCLSFGPLQIEKLINIIKSYIPSACMIYKVSKKLI